MNSRNSRPKDVKTTAAINSAALQDHLLKKFNFNLDTNFNNSNREHKRKNVDKLPAIVKGIQKQIQKMEKNQKNSILPYENESLKRLKEAKSDEEKMFKYNKGLTWAQKLGIVEAPPPPLTAKDWQAIEEKSKARNDSDNCCSICLEDFKIQPQTILSCSHVFHMKCLNSYEKHNKLRCCPICRRRDYEKKVIDDAIRAFTLKSIIRIQRVFRGSQTRINLYKKLVEGGYIGKTLRFNRRLIGFKIWKLSHKIEERVKKSEQYFQKLMQQVERKYQQSKGDILDEIVEVQRKKLMNQNEIEKYLEKLGIKMEGKKQEKVDWQYVKQKGISRKDEQCSICLMALWSKPVYLLSCTHLFHANCIEGFQRYSLPGHKNKCPCCRAQYQKKLVQTIQK